MTMFKDRPFFANVISSYMRSNNEGLFATRSVGELLWGYQDGLLQALQTIEPSLDDVFGLFYKVKTIKIIPIVTIILQRTPTQFPAFFFSQSNASNDGEYVFFTGQQNSQDFARVDTWNGSRSVDGSVASLCKRLIPCNHQQLISSRNHITADEPLQQTNSDRSASSLSFCVLHHVLG